MKIGFPGRQLTRNALGRRYNKHIHSLIAFRFTQPIVSPHYLFSFCAELGRIYACRRVAKGQRYCMSFNRNMPLLNGTVAKLAILHFSFALLIALFLAVLFKKDLHRSKGIWGFPGNRSENGHRFIFSSKNRGKKIDPAGGLKRTFSGWNEKYDPPKRI